MRACTCAALLAALFSSCPACAANGGNEPYVRQRQYSPAQDAENAQWSRELLDNLQATARSCKDVRLVFTSLREPIKDREIPLSAEEKAELLALILKIEPVKCDACARINRVVVFDMLFTMPDGAVKRVNIPNVTGRSRVSTDGYAFMTRYALPDADAARWHALHKHEWVWSQIERNKKRAGR